MPIGQSNLEPWKGWKWRANEHRNQLLKAPAKPQPDRVDTPSGSNRTQIHLDLRRIGFVLINGKPGKIYLNRGHGFGTATAAS